MTNLLDQNPIYCVEQILIPEGLPALLKAFAKEAIRNNPKELESFAWRYFEKLAATVKLDETAPPPTVPQIIKVWEKSREIEFTNQEPMRKIMISCGIALNTCDNIFKLADFPSDLIDPKEVIVLLITSACKSSVTGAPEQEEIRKAKQVKEIKFDDINTHPIMTDLMKIV